MIALLVITLVVYVLWAVLPNITKLLTENKQLRLAITNLTQEDTIGYAKVIWQGERDGYPGVKFTRLVFVETNKNNKSNEVLRKEIIRRLHFFAIAQRKSLRD
jgi:hypothetical protein